MVKVREELAMAEPKQPPNSSTTSSTSSTSPYLPRTSRKPRHGQSQFHHLHIPFHHHFFYPAEGAEANGGGESSSGSSPAKFFFGPGFEAQGDSFGSNTEHVVYFHVNPGVTISFQIGDTFEVLRGPVTVPMVSTNSSPPIAMPVQVPPGHVVQQIVDERGTLRHVILSTQHPAGLVPLPSHTPQHYSSGPANGTNQAQPFFAQGLPGQGFPPPHFHHSGTLPTGHGHAPPHGPHSPPPPHSYYKDDRAQRQYVKLKRKLQYKQLKGDSPRHDLVNGGLLAPPMAAQGAAIPSRDKGMNSVGTSEDGEESGGVPDEDDAGYYTDVLSSVQSPKVSELSSRSALIQWAAPLRLSEASSNDSHDLDISETDLRYEVLLSDKSKEMKYKSIYSGASLSCRIQDLRPGQEYSVCLQVHLYDWQGSASDPVKFVTPPCEPDQPQSPKLLNKTKNSLQLRWNSVNDNGSHILHYILECDNGKGGEFVELHKSKGKQYTVSRLQSGTAFRFRLAAINEIGRSAYSDIASYTTCCNPPTQPAAPLLREATITSLRLYWQQRPKDDTFILQKDDLKSQLGYLNVYNGPDCEYVCENLERFSEYRFRLRAENDGGCSPWTDDVVYRTLPDRPARPTKPIVKGRIHAHSFKLKWEPPSNTGGADITNYILELNSGSGYHTVYAGNETEAVCDKLTPGTTYQLRVICVSQGGGSLPSDPCTVTTDAVVPGHVTELRLATKAKPTVVHIKWSEPDYNGGAPVLDYEVEMTDRDNSRVPVHKGKELECVVNGLGPGCTYNFVVRAVNRVGAGAWSETLIARCAAAPPSAPNIPMLSCKSPFHMLVEWTEPPNNGSSISEYRLEVGLSESEDQFQTAFQGLATSHDLKSLTPFTVYYLRVQACNSAGYGPFSSLATATTPAAPPAIITTIHATPRTNSILLEWTEPVNHGAPILHYNVEVAAQQLSTTEPLTTYNIEGLSPATTYKVKIQAVNSVGLGSYSSTLRLTTLPLPPPPPHLECVGNGHNYLKLKWGEGKNVDFTQYWVEMENVRSKEFQCVYQGTAFSCKVNKLQELTTYRFRICASNDTGDGDFSDEYEFRTAMAPPSGLKQPKTVEIDKKSCILEWNGSRNTFSDPVEYVVQLTRLKDQDFKQVYRGVDTKCTLDHLEPGAEYSARVYPIRMSATTELQGPYSSQLVFNTTTTELPMTTKLSATSTLSASPSHMPRTKRFMRMLHPTISVSDGQGFFIAFALVVVGVVITPVLAWLCKINT